jgi:DNA polymerase I
MSDELPGTFLDPPEVDITGFEYKRSDIAPITKRVQREVIEMIVTGEDIADVESYVREVIDEYKEGNVDLDDVGIPGGIGKRLDAYDTDTAQVRGAKYANLLFGTNFGRGSKPKRLYLEKNGIHPDYFERIDDDVAEDPLFESFKRDVSAGDGVVCFEYADQVPEEFAVDWEKMLDKTLKGPIARVLEALDVSWEEVETGQQQTGLGSFM